MPTAKVIQLDSYRPLNPTQPPKSDLKERIKQVLSEATLVETQEETERLSPEFVMAKISCLEQQLAILLQQHGGQQ